MSEGLPLEKETELLAWLVLQAANRTQARGSTVRLVVLRAPEVAYDLGGDLGEDRYLASEKWLLEQGYLTPANVGLTWGTYTVTSAGLEWLREGMPKPLEVSTEATEQPGRVEPQPPLESEQTASGSPADEQQGRGGPVSDAGGPREESSDALGGPGSGTARGSWWRRMLGG